MFFISIRCFIIDPSIEHRLWIQCAPPRAPDNKKRKRPAANERGLKKKRAMRVASRPAPKRAQAPAPKPARVAKSGLTSTPTRAAKLKAQTQLNKQAKELARYQASLTSRGTRASARLRGSSDDMGEWQTIPDEWLEESAPASNNRTTRRSMRSNGRKATTPSSESSSEESELTELSSEEDEKSSSSSNVDDSDEDAEGSVDDAEDRDDRDDSLEESASSVPEDFVEWETVSSNDSLCARLFI
jgi:hypothetical protein